MDFTLDKSLLSWLVQTASKPIPARATLPVLKNVLIEGTSGQITVSGTNLDWGIRVTIPCQCESSGSMTVNSKLLQDVIRTLSSGEVRMSLSEAEWSLLIASGTSKMYINASPGEDFPPWPEENDSQELVLDKDVFRRMVEVGTACAVANAARPLWAACFMEVKDNELRMVSTDLFSLAVARTAVKSPKFGVIVLAKVLQDLASLLDDQDEDSVRIRIGPNHVFFSLGPVNAFARLIEGQYYAYEQVIPKSFRTQVRMDTEKLIASASRASVLASEEDKAMRLRFSSGSVTVRAGSSDKGRMEEEIPAEVEGDEMEICIQHRYALLAAKGVGSARTVLKATGEVSPLAIEPLGDDSPVKPTFVVMPMKPGA